MNMRRHALTDEQWQRLEPVLPKQRHGPPSKIGDREFVDAVLYRAKTVTQDDLHDLANARGAGDGRNQEKILEESKS